MENIGYLFAFIFVFVMLFVFLRFNRKTELKWHIISLGRVGNYSQVVYDLHDGERFVDRIQITKTDDGQCHVESMESGDELAVHYNSLPKDAHVDWAEACLELYLKKHY
jgi:hypothetical protein